MDNTTYRAIGCCHKLNNALEHDTHRCRTTGPFGGAAFAVCTCGWEGPLRMWEAEADADIVNHQNRVKAAR